MSIIYSQMAYYKLCVRVCAHTSYSLLQWIYLFTVLFLKLFCGFEIFQNKKFAKKLLNKSLITLIFNSVPPYARWRIMRLASQALLVSFLLSFTSKLSMTQILGKNETISAELKQTHMGLHQLFSFPQVAGESATWVASHLLLQCHRLQYLFGNVNIRLDNSGL